MKALVQKEIRLLAPAYALALFLAVVPLWLLPTDASAALCMLLFWFGAMMLGLSAFGREFSLRTLPLILAQPLERNQIWRTKTAVLAGAMASVFAAWCLCCMSYMYLHPGMRQASWWEMLTIAGTAAVVTFAGGLWTTLLLRQVSAAFWFTILAPAAIALAIDWLGGSPATVVAALGLYSVLGFFWARRLFFRFQEAGWTGGVILIPGWRSHDAALQPALRAHRPLAALFWKELQLQQVSLLAIGGLFLLHLAVVEVRRFGHDSLGATLRAGLEVFGGLWLIVPLLVGSSSVADERNLGVTPELLCLPISSRLQYALKLLVVLVLGGVLSGLLLWTAEGIGTTVHGGSNIEAFKTPFQFNTLVSATLICLGLSLIGFYASTLTRSIIQALAAAAATAAGLWMAEQFAAAIAVGNLPLLGFHLWWGYLVFYIALPVLVGTLLPLAYRNFRGGSGDSSLWHRNLLGLAGALLFAATLTTAAYHRAWELVMPIEPRHGPAMLIEPASANPSGTPPSGASSPNSHSQLTPVRPLQLHSYGGSALSALLPDGRLWVDLIGYDPGRLVLAFDGQTGFRVGGKLESLSGNQIQPGSNWVAVAAAFFQTVAIRADGTLWVSEKPREDSGWRWSEMRPTFEEAAPLVRFGRETNWQNVVRYGFEPLPVILQKRDGTLWCWYEDHPLPKNSERLGLRSFEPRRLGTDSDWARVLYTSGGVCAWKNDGRAWVFHPPVPSGKPRKEEVSLAPDVVMERSAALDNFKSSSLTDCWPWHAAVREDGTLWGWINVPPTPAQNGQSFVAQRPLQIGSERDWRAVAGGSGNLTALKADGSLWQWQLSYERQQEFGLPTNAPVRLGTHNDWLGVGRAMNGAVSLAADGSLWYWWSRRPDHYSDYSSQPMLAPSRRPYKIENILEGGKL
ncbi:MAG: hypothetical protein ACLQVX_20905 [Limisphaerales bacterium]